MSTNFKAGKSCGERPNHQGVQIVFFRITKNPSSMNQELIYHQKKQQGKMIIAEFLINDFRFWCDVEEGFLIDA